ncbi:MAG: hypothetical protein AAB288_09765 [Acidobacteriota bacterium]
MKNQIAIVITFACFVVFGAELASAQFPIKLPKIRAEKPKPEQAKTAQPNTEAPSASAPASASSEPTNSRYSATVRKSQYDFVRPTAKPLLVLDSVYVQAVTHNAYWKTPNVKQSSWVPRVRFSIFYDWKESLNYTAEYFNPDGSLWYSEPLEGDNRSADLTVPFTSNRDTNYRIKLRDTKSSIGTGIYGVKITNSATGEVAFQGKFKVGKYPIQYSRETRNEYFVDHDWLMPIGTVGFHFANFTGSDIGTNFPVEVSMWFKKSLGDTDHGLEGRLFYKGQQIATTKPNAREDRATEAAALSADTHHWRRWDFQWSDRADKEVNVDNGGEYHRDNMPKSFFIDRNPGEYTVKVYHLGVQVREAKFTVGTDGRVVDGEFQKPGYLTYHKVIIPVTIIGAAEKWNAAAWKTDAFYANPLKGFPAN